MNREYVFLMKLMKASLVLVLLAGVFISCTLVSAETIDLEGSWVGNSDYGNSKDDGFFDGKECSMEITKQESGAFTGTLSFIDGGGERTVGFSGIVGDDGKMVYLAGYDQGIGIGTLYYNNNEMMLSYIEPGSDAVAVHLLFEKVEGSSSSDAMMASPTTSPTPRQESGEYPPPSGSVN